MSAITDFEIHTIPAFSDNYLWLISQGGEAAVVDPGDATPILQKLNELQLSLSAILVTHHHPDHTGGIAQLKQQTGAKVFGPKSIKIPQVETSVDDGDVISILGTEVSVVTVPGHTLDHIAYFIPSMACNDGSFPRLFCGDTLFAGGCGRVFEGSFAQMRASLEKLRALPVETRVYCAHEYTQANLKFAVAVEPDNQQLLSRIKTAEALRQKNVPTVPSTIADELASNPFLRYNEAAVIASAEAKLKKKLVDTDEVFAAIRGWKDSF